LNTGFLQIWNRLETIQLLTASDLKAGHRDKVLGHLWNLLDPLFLIGVYFVVFGLGFRLAIGSQLNFVLYLSIGVLAWRFLDAAIGQATVCVRNHRGLIHEVSFPKSVLPISICFSRLYDFVWGLIVLLVVMAFAEVPLTLHLLWVPLLVLLQLLFVAGVVAITAYLGAFYADTTNVTALITRVWFFASPIFYLSSGEQGIIPEAYLGYYNLNPLAGLLDCYRDAILWGKTPDLNTLAYLAAVALLSAAIGHAVFSHGEGKFAKYI